MLQRIFMLASFVGLVWAGSAQAHGPDGHRPPTSVTETTAKQIAKKQVAALVKRDKLEKSWAAIKPSSANKVDNKGTLEWVVLFLNEKATDSERRKLYVFLTLGGRYIAANHTGK